MLVTCDIQQELVCIMIQRELKLLKKQLPRDLDDITAGSPPLYLLFYIIDSTCLLASQAVLSLKIAVCAVLALIRREPQLVKK